MNRSDPLEASYQSLGRALEELEAALFVDREREFRAFHEWLADEDVPILSVVGRGGTGKTTLLAALARAAVDRGRDVLWIGDDDSATPEPLAGGEIESLNERCPVVFVDAPNASLTRHLVDDVLPHLARGVKVVVAERSALGPSWTRWRSMTRQITIGPLPAEAARRYLLRRGVPDLRLVDQIVRATAGQPLALSLAADVVLEAGVVVDLGAATEWRLVVRRLVDQLMNDVGDPDLARLLEAGAIVRQFDESTLSAMTRSDDVSAAFGQLCGLSVVRAGDHGLMLHDDIRRIVSDDLRWRNADRYDELRSRALVHLRERMLGAPPEDRHWLSAERMYLWEDAFVRSLVFGTAVTADVTLSFARPEDADSVLAIERRFQDDVLPQQARIEWPASYPKEAMLAWMSRALRLDGARVAVAADAQGALTGYGLVLPLYTDAVAALLDEPILSKALVGHLGDTDPSAFPVRPDDAKAFYLVQVAVLDLEPEATNAALFRDMLGLFTREGLYLATAAMPAHRTFLESLRFVAIEGATSPGWIARHPCQGYVLDLTRIGFEPWIEAVMSGRAPVARPTVDALEAELAELLPVLDSDDHAAASSLGAGDPHEARRLIRDTISRLEAHTSDELRLAARAVGLAYVERAASHERLAERLSVSRSTFYRLLKRGTRAIAEALGRAAQ